MAAAKKHDDQKKDEVTETAEIKSDENGNGMEFNVSFSDTDYQTT